MILKLSFFVLIQESNEKKMTASDPVLENQETSVAKF